VSSLEAELKSTSKALKDANATKTSTEKAAKAAKARASKAEKALTEAAKKQATREGAVVERLDAIVASVGIKFFGLPLYPATLVLVDILLLAYLYFRDAAEQLGEVMKLCLECTKDPLLDSVDVLESKWRIVRDIL
jgi:Flp pilus assembly protein TadB